MKKTLSIISPVYNEGAGLERFSAAVKEILQAPEFSRYDVEIILVDNASTDNSAEYIERIVAGDDRFRAIFNARNVGVFLSSFNALRFAKGDAVFLMVPTDLQDPLTLMPEMIRHWENGCLLVAGRRVQRQEPWLMRALRNRFYRILSTISDYPLEVGVGEYQLADRRVVDDLLAIPDAMPFPRGLLSELGYKPHLIDYEWQRRQWGKSSFNFSRLVSTAYNMIVSSSRLPLRLILIAGIFVAGLSILFGIFQIVLYLVDGTTAPQGITTLIVAQFFFSGINAIFLGIIGEYVGRILQQTRYGRRVSVSRMINFPSR
ncbi:MAG: glycosyltransferase family 2 protein [Hyphomicrobium sp.]